MNTMIWIGQILLAAVFFVAGASKLIAYKSLIKTIEERRKTAPIRITTVQGHVIALLEIAGAIGVILPPAWTPEALAPDYLLVRAAAGCLALLMVGATIYHLRRKESAAPAISTFLLAGRTRTGLRAFTHLRERSILNPQLRNCRRPNRNHDRPGLSPRCTPEGAPHLKGDEFMISL